MVWRIPVFNLEHEKDPGIGSSKFYGRAEGGDCHADVQERLFQIFCRIYTQ